MEQAKAGGVSCAPRPRGRPREPPAVKLAPSSLVTWVGWYTIFILWAAYRAPSHPLLSLPTEPTLQLLPPAWVCAFLDNSMVVDLCGKMVLAYRIGNDMTSSLVTDTIQDAIQKKKVADGLTLHSDQGSQYTSQAYFDLSQEYHLRSSMSSPGCPFDNAAMENFFGTLKTECLYRMKISCRDEVEQAIAEYVLFYNFERINRKRQSGGHL